MLCICGVFFLVAAYGQWQHARRANIETATVTPLPNVSPTASPNKR